jgi:DNA-binding SARP family transcriptional activator/streptogramin lyase
VPRDEIAEVLWEDAPPASWEKALRVLVSKLRGVLNLYDTAADLTAAFGCYQLDLPGDTWVDSLAAEDAAGDAEDLLTAGDLKGAVAAATLAEALLRQPFMPGEDGAWVLARRRELADVRVRVLDVLAESCVRVGKVEAAVRWAEQAVEANKFRESGYRRLMAAHVAAGDRAEALRVYEKCRRLLAEELGAYPSPETEELYRRLLEEPTARGDTTAASTTDPLDGAASVAAGRAWSSRRRRTAALAVAVLVVTGAVLATLIFVKRGDPTPTVLPNSLIRVDPSTLKVTQVVPVADAPDLVVSSGGYLWVTNEILRDRGSGEPRNAGDRTLTRVDPTTGNAVVVGGGLAPCGITADPSGDVWVANCYPTTISALRDDVVRVDARTLVFKQTFPAPGGDGFYRGLAYGGGSLWLSQIVGGDLGNPDTVTQIDPQTGKERTIDFAREASGLAWSGGYGDLWIANFRDGGLTRLNTVSGAEEWVEDVAAGPSFPVADGNVIWVADWSGPRVLRLNAVGSAQPRVIALPEAAAGVWSIAVGAGAAWATTPADGAIWRIDRATNAATRINLPYFPTGVTADANNVWVTIRGR